MPDIKVTPLGAGQDVGRSCLLLSMGGKNIMLDCGMHMGYNDERRFPDFSYIVPEGKNYYSICMVLLINSQYFFTFQLQVQSQEVSIVSLFRISIWIIAVRYLTCPKWLDTPDQFT